MSVLWALWTKGSEYELNSLNQGNKPVLIPLILQILQKDWWKIGIGLGILIAVIVALIRLL